MVSTRNRDREEREARERLRLYNARQQVQTHRVRRRRLDNILGVSAGLFVVILAAVSQVLYFTAGPGVPVPSPTATATTPANQNVGDVPSKSIAEGRSWTGTLVLNDDINLGIELTGASAPQGASAFIYLTNINFYVGKTCHRLTNGDSHLIQCGSTYGNGQGDAGFSFGPIENAPADGIYPAGTIALARQAGPYTQGTQFFITYQDTQLDTSTGGYTVLGHVTSGLDVLNSMVTSAGVGEGGTSANDGPPVVPTTITSISIK